MSRLPMLIQVIRQPQKLLTLTLHEQEQLVRQLRVEGLLAHIGYRLQQAQLWQQLSPELAQAIESAMVHADERRRMLRWEVNRIRRALRSVKVPVILLKGAAYALSDLPNARGRLVADVDIMLREEELPLVEAALEEHGWQPTKLDAYDQNYYRQWMHEIPPLKHVGRLSELDVHHTIIPKTSRLKPDVGALWATARPLAGGEPQYNGLLTLAPAEMVLHAVVHLFQEDLYHGLRGLVDCDQLLRHYAAQEEDFWPQLILRAERLDLARPLSYALHFCQQLLGTPIPKATMVAAQQHGPSAPIRLLLYPLMARMFHPQLGRVGHEDRLDLAARLLLYIRAHWLRMPPGLLLSHLSRKGTRRWGPHVWHNRNR
uniref:Nucleotidyltransferase family protein n=1 Tax=Magnetococcus massalia (strain MO-1) TaxID=451514 RepID=A0A1S7LPF8_MAGMO|nr:Conserved protein of unknown function [Candidatus Magnetococcus massalia]